MRADMRRLLKPADAPNAVHGRGLQVLAAVLSLLTVSAITVLARPYVWRALARGEMALIPAGPVLIGTNKSEASDDEKPQWTTELEAFEIDRYEVSNARYRLCVTRPFVRNHRIPQNSYADAYTNYPVAGVTAFQANTFCRWLGKRLPTELEWERAARGPDGRDWPWGNEPPAPSLADLALGTRLGEGLLPVDSLSAGESIEGAGFQSGWERVGVDVIL